MKFSDNMIWFYNDVYIFNVDLGRSRICSDVNFDVLKTLLFWIYFDGIILKTNYFSFWKLHFGWRGSLVTLARTLTRSINFGRNEITQHYLEYLQTHNPVLKQRSVSPSASWQKLTLSETKHKSGSGWFSHISASLRQLPLRQQLTTPLKGCIVAR